MLVIELKVLFLFNHFKKKFIVKTTLAWFNYNQTFDKLNLYIQPD